MRLQYAVKVLYTFDDENKTNCLARWPHLLDIQTAFLDEKTQIGVIELKTCIQAIVSARCVQTPASILRSQPLILGHVRQPGIGGEARPRLHGICL